ncbi:MAG: hydantoinase/oxoprolinase family protein [Acidimicrobiales bacterium]
MDPAASGVRVGVDVGGTFTKAVAVDATGIVAQAVRPTTHDDVDGVSAGVVRVVADVAAELGGRPIALVTHSTTQAVNALLEGDVGLVGVIGMGRRPDLRKAAKRTMLDDIELAPGKRLRTMCEFVDLSDGLDEARVESIIGRFVEAGAVAACVAEAFATEDATNEATVAAIAARHGLAVCTSTEMSGLYGLELRAVTAALNASILPIAMATADVVADGVRAVGIDAPVMVMRGDGGATDLDGFRREPARTLYSGPAASVAGVLRHSRVDDGIVIEVGGTSTNVAAISSGRPALSYVRVASHSTALRAVDVRVVGVAGGSMLRSRRNKVYGVGPRSAHIAGLRYACFVEPSRLDGATAELFAPRSDDPADYLAVRLADGDLVALTNTCAANALGMVEDGDYAQGSAAAARAAFAAAGVFLRLDGDEVARRMLEASGNAVAELVTTLIDHNHLDRPTVVAVGGGAGGLGRYTAALLGLECSVPEHAEVISSVGDALSLIRVEHERTIRSPTAEEIEGLVALAREDALAAGAAGDSLDVRFETDSERMLVRAIATGAVALQSGAAPGRRPIDLEEATRLLAAEGCTGEPTALDSYWWSITPAPGRGVVERLVVLDRFGDVALDEVGEAVMYGADIGHDRLAATVERHTRHLGPMKLPPTVWVLAASQLIEISAGDVVATVTGIVGRLADGDAALVLVTKEH